MTTPDSNGTGPQSEKPPAAAVDNVVYPIVFASGRAAFPDGSHLDNMRRAASARDPASHDHARGQMPSLRNLADRAMRDEPPVRLSALHSYWFCLGDGMPPERSLINPAAIAPLLPDLLLLEKDETRNRLRYRLTGTRIDHWNGCNLTGRYLDDVAAQDTTGITDFIRRHGEQALRSRRAYIGHYDWYAAAPDPLHRRWQPPFALLQRPIRLWLGLFPLSVGGRIRQCLAIAEHDGLPIDTAPAPWILDSGFSGGVIPGRWRDA